MVKVECPGEAHELDNTFNPSTQGAYGVGYHYCDLCDNEGEITPEEYKHWEHEQLAKKLSVNSKKCLT